MTRLLHVLGSAGLGGSESLCLSLARHMQSIGIEQDVLFLTDTDGPARDRLAGWAIPAGSVAATTRWGLISGVSNYVRRTKPDAVLSFMFGVHAFVGIGARLGGARSTLAFVGNPPPKDDRAKRRSSLLGALGAPFTSHVVACSEYVARRMRSGYGHVGGRATVIHNWCEVDAIARRVAEIQPEERREPRRIGMIARLDPIKDHASLLKAFAKVRADRPNVELRIVGEGPLAPELRSLAAELAVDDAVTFVGPTPDPIAELADMDIFAFATTEEEGFGLVLAEAMAAGVPIVATAVGPVPEVLAEGRGGLLCPSTHARDLAHGLARLLDEPGLRREVSGSARILVRERYEVSTAAQRIISLIDG